MLTGLIKIVYSVQPCNKNTLLSIQMFMILFGDASKNNCPSSKSDLVINLPLLFANWQLKPEIYLMAEAVEEKFSP